MNVNFGLFPPLPTNEVKGKDRKQAMANARSSDLSVWLGKKKRPNKRNRFTIPPVP